MELRFGDITVACSSVDRVVFPAVGITKGDVIAYYRDIAAAMLPEVHGRPLTLERFTKGLAGGGFYQKHYQKHFPAWIDRVELGGQGARAKKKKPSAGAGEAAGVVYPICDTQAGLVYMANQGTIAFHVGTSRKGALEKPDQIVFDLDPPEGGFDLVRRTAHAVRLLMEELGLPIFVKTSGSKGLHLIVPVDGHATYADVTLFCTRAAARLCEAHPDLVTTEFYKKDRKGRLFLDTLRNALGATVVAAWSVRGRPSAPVSAPITWAEVDDPALAPDGIHLRDIAGRLAAHGDPWAGLRTREGSVADALAKLAPP